MSNKVSKNSAGAPETIWLTQRLTDFRQCLENDLGNTIATFDPTAPLLLDDLCEFLELTEADRTIVFGTEGMEAIKQLTG